MILGREGLDFLPKIIYLEDIISTNGISLKANDSNSSGGLFLNTSRINHSCVSNTDLTCHKGSHQVLFANRDIIVGEEITVSYIVNLIHRELRQFLLKR